MLRPLHKLPDKQIRPEGAEGWVVNQGRGEAGEGGLGWPEEEDERCWGEIRTSLLFVVQILDVVTWEDEGEVVYAFPYVGMEPPIFFQ